MKFKLIAGMVGIALAFGANAAEPPKSNSALTEAKGKVLVNTGKAFAPAALDMRLKAGDRVMVQEDSEATITFDDGCKLEVEENKLVSVPDRSSCAGAVVMQQGINPVGGAAIGGGAASNGALPIAAVLAFDAYMFFHEDEHDTVSP